MMKRWSGVGLALLLWTLPHWADDADLIGLWGTRYQVPAAFEGRVSAMLSKNGAQTVLDRLCIDGRCRSVADGAALSMELPTQGELRLRPGTGDLTEATVHWIQPAAATYNGWATPVRLHGPDGTGSKPTDRAHGSIRPFRESRTFYLKIDRDDKGALRVFLRDPERNIGRYARLATLRRDGRQLELLNEGGDVVTTAVLSEDGSRMALEVPRYGTQDLRRITAEDAAVGFYPRPLAATPPDALQPPLSDRDWTAASPQSVGMDEQQLLGLVRSIAETKVDSVWAPALHAMLVARDGKLVVEEYFAGHDAESLHDTRSAGKSIASMLVGAAVGTEGLSMTVCSQLGWAKDVCDADPRRAAMNLEHLLTMSPGMACNDDVGDSPGNEDAMQSQSAEPDWYRFTMDVPMERQPGEKALYCSAGINLVGAVLTAHLDAEVYQLFDELLARPLGIDRYHMNLDPLGRGYLGGGIRLRPRDMLKFGEMMRNGGMWRGKRVLPADWVQASSAAHASIHEDQDYGYAWWRISLEVEGRTIESFYASGNGGQMLFVVPELRLSALFMGGNYGNFGTWRAFRDEYLPSILRAAMRGDGK